MNAAFPKGTCSKPRKIVILFIIHEELAPVTKKTARNEPLLLHVGFFKGKFSSLRRKKGRSSKGGVVCVVP
jgi:hypothetical protein